MKRTLFIALIAALMVPAGLTAQEVYMESGQIILDMTVAAGMPAGAITNISKTEVYNSYDAINYNSWLINSADNSHSGYLGATVYEKLEIAPQDMAGDDFSPTLSATGTAIRWVSAFNRCKGLTHGGNTDWRLPTQRELQMIWIFKDAFENLGLTFSSTTEYWSVTEVQGMSVRIVSFDNGGTGVNIKQNYFNARCVREIVTP